MPFLDDQVALVDDVFDWRGQEVRIYCGSIGESIHGIYRDPFAEQGAGELVIGLNEPTLRVRDRDVSGFSVQRGSRVEIVKGAICLTVEQVEPSDDGTTYYQLRRGWKK